MEEQIEKKNNKSISVLIVVAFLGIILVVKNILNWLKFKKQKEKEF